MIYLPLGVYPEPLELATSTNLLEGEQIENVELIHGRPKSIIYSCSLLNPFIQRFKLLFL